MALLGELWQRLPHICSDREALSLGHSTLAIPSTDSNELTSQRNLNESMVRTAIDHFRALNQSPVTFVKLKELPTLLATADIDSSIHAAL